MYARTLTDEYIADLLEKARNGYMRIYLNDDMSLKDPPMDTDLQAFLDFVGGNTGVFDAKGARAIIWDIYNSIIKLRAIVDAGALNRAMTYFSGDVNSEVMAELFEKLDEANKKMIQIIFTIIYDRYENIDAARRLSRHGECIYKLFSQKNRDVVGPLFQIMVFGSFDQEMAINDMPEFFQSVSQKWTI